MKDIQTKNSKLILLSMILSVAAGIPAHAVLQQKEAIKLLSLHENKSQPGDRVTAFRFRTGFGAELDENTGWAGEINEATAQKVDTPFRVRFELESDGNPGRRQYSLQYRRNDGPWIYMEVQEFPYPSAASPAASIVGCDAFFYGEEAGNLLEGSSLPAGPGAGICLAPVTPGWEPASAASVEWEWAVVIRRWTDGPGRVLDGDRFELRMIDQHGEVPAGPTPSFTVNVPDGHLGGTFVETPARIGPWETGNGDLYFIMEPTETDNRFMIVHSTDNGRSWVEADSENRPAAVDLEGVGSVMTPDGLIHAVHQTSDAVYYHAFATTDHASRTNQWMVNSEVIATPAEPPVQTCDVVARPDGSLVAVFAAGTELQYSIRDEKGSWSKARSLYEGNTESLTNPSLLTLPGGKVLIAFKSTDGKGWSQTLLPDNSLTSPEPLADDLGTTEAESMTILPLAYLEERQAVLAVFRRSDGYLYYSLKSGNKAWTTPLPASDRPVVVNAVDSDQAGADVVVHNNQVYIAFIAEDDRDLYLSVIDPIKKKTTITPIVKNINGSWVRGRILYNQSQSPVYGIIYDAGSKGGSGYNKFVEVKIR